MHEQRSGPAVLLVAVGLAVLAGGAPAQTTIRLFRGDAAEDKFGRAVGGAGDVNGDGYADVIVGAEGADPNGPFSGHARVFSGLDGSVLYAIDGRNEDAFFGSSVAGAGDVDGDGYEDFVVGAHGDSLAGFLSGSAHVFSGLDGVALHSFFGAGAADFFGRSVDGAGDVNGDGYADVVVGADGAERDLQDSGLAVVYSGLDGMPLHVFEGDSSFERFASAVAGAGDVNADGYADVIVGSRLNAERGAEAGMARVFSGLDGTVLHTFLGEAASDELGGSVDGAGDVDADGYADLIVGASRVSTGGVDAGMARVYSGFDGEVLHTFLGSAESEFLGAAVAGAGDVDQDGYADVVVGATGGALNGTNAGSATVFSGFDGSVIFTVDGFGAGDSLGAAVAGAGDVDNDGSPDVVVGAWGDDDNGSNSGSVRVVSAGLACVPDTANYCTAVTNSSGFAGQMGWSGSTNVVDQNLTLMATGCPVGQSAIFIYGLDATETPLGNGNLCIGSATLGFVLRLPPSRVDDQGMMTLEFDFRDPPAPEGTIDPGSTWFFQAWFRDEPAQAGSFNLSDGLRITFCP